MTHEEKINLQIETIHKQFLEPDANFESKSLNFKPTWNADPEQIAIEANNLETACLVGGVFPHPYSTLDAKGFIDYAIDAWNTGEEFCFGIFDKSTDKYIGNIGFKFNEDGNVVKNIGYWLGESHFGKGFATEALNACLDFIGINFPNVKKVLAYTVDYNIGSQRVLEKCGFIKLPVEKQPQETEVLRNGKIIKNIDFEKAL